MDRPGATRLSNVRDFGGCPVSENFTLIEGENMTEWLRARGSFGGSRPRPATGSVEWVTVSRERWRAVFRIIIGTCIENKSRQYLQSQLREMLD